MKFSYLLCGLLLFASCKKSKTETQLTKITAKTIAVDSTFAPSVKIDNFIAPYKQKLASEMQQKLSYAPKDFLKDDGKMQSSLSNLMADLTFEMANPKFNKKTNEDIDFVLLNNGGIRATIPKGNITTERAFKLMPFENELVAVTLSGEKIVALINYFVKSKRAHPLSKTIALTIKDNGFLLKIKGKPFDKNKSYTVLTNDYLLNGGDNMHFFKNPEKLTKLDYKVRDALIDYFKKTDTIKASIDNRILIK